MIALFSTGEDLGLRGHDRRKGHPGVAPVSGLTGFIYMEIVDLCMVYGLIYGIWYMVYGIWFDLLYLHWYWWVVWNMNFIFP